MLLVETLLLSFCICCPSSVMNLAIYGHRQAILTPSAFLKLHSSWAKQLLCALAEPSLGCSNFSFLLTPEEPLKMKGLLLSCFWESDFAAIFMPKLGVFLFLVLCNVLKHSSRLWSPGSDFQACFISHWIRKWFRILKCLGQACYELLFQVSLLHLQDEQKEALSCHPASWFPWRHSPEAD